MQAFVVHTQDGQRHAGGIKRGKKRTSIDALDHELVSIDCIERSAREDGELHIRGRAQIVDQNGNALLWLQAMSGDDCLDELRGEFVGAGERHTPNARFTMDSEPQLNF